MLVNVQVRPILYKPGTVMDSMQSRDIIGSTSQIRISVGASFVVPERMQKVIFTERFGDIYVDRVFLMLKNQESSRRMFPLFIKIYDKGTAHVLLYRMGIATALDSLCQQEKPTGLVRDVNFAMVMEDVKHQDQDLLDTINERRGDHCTDGALVNDEATWIYPIKDVHLVDPYPWDSCHTLIKELAMREQFKIARWSQYVASLLFELHVQIPRVQDIFPHTHPVWYEIDEIFNPRIGELYENIAFDRLTLLCLDEPELYGKTIIRRTGMLWPKHTLVNTLSENPFQWKEGEFEFVSCFSSEILQLCVWLHQLPFSELALSYTLPNWQRLAKYVVHNAVSRNGFKAQIRDFFTEIQQIFRVWDSDEIEKIDIVMTSTDELFLRLHTDSTVRNLYIDLTMSVLLSQSVTREV